ncbi:DUF3224 domain-containing protein [Actinosynnema sp. NPDC020468]|uniref:DUF3224 domain-containing protein n=1 Tax=Actinosynnema sp. NPDC020468 TaxID=3154488 RepID=UPI003402E561
MTTHATGTAEMKSWDEHTWDGRNYDETKAPKQTTGGMTSTWAGDLEGTAETRFLMHYPTDDTCTSIGFEVVTGTLAGRTGTLVLHHDGGYANGVADGTFTIVGATGDLTGTTGTGRLTWLHGEPGRYTLDYDLA